MNGPSQTPEAQSRKRRGKGADRSPLNALVLIGAAAALVLAAGIAVIWPGNDDAEPVATAPPSNRPVPENRNPETAAQSTLPRDNTFSMAAMPRKDGTDAAVTDIEPTLSVPFELEDIAGALSSVELDEDGMPVLNETTREILDTAFMQTAEPMTGAELEQLQSMIEAGLEGEAGERAADIAGRYHNYSREYREIADTLEMQGSDPEALRANFEQVSILRRSHLGEDVARQMFGQEEALTRYTLEAMTIQGNPELTPEQKARREESLRESADELREAGLIAAPEAEPAADQEQAN